MRTRHHHSQAVAVVSGTIATLGYMYIAGRQTKAEQGPESIYSAFPTSCILSPY